MIYTKRSDFITKLQAECRHHCAAASAQTHRLFRDAMIFCAFEKMWELITTSKRL